MFPRSSDNSFFLQWICACTISNAISWALINSITWSNSVTFGVITGLIFGIPQWFVLKNKLSKASYWIGATVLGYVVFRLFSDKLAYVFLPPDLSSNTLVVSGLGNLIGGIFGGIAQSRVLKRQAYSSEWWVLILSLTWLTTAIVGELTAPTFGGFVSGGFVGLLEGVLTGVPLVLLLNRY